MEREEIPLPKQSIPIDDLKPSGYNPRQLTRKQYSNLRRSISELGFVAPVIVNTYPGRENVIVGGHQRVSVAKDLGIEKIPCFLVFLSPDKEREANVRLNRNTGEWDFDALANDFEAEDLIEWGFEARDFGLSTYHTEDLPCNTGTAASPGESSADIKGAGHGQGRYTVSVICEDQDDQKRTYDELTEAGYSCERLRQ